MPKPTIAAINGFALGGGCELALACDLRYASSTREARPARDQPRDHPGLGRHAAARAGRAALGFAKELILTGRLVDAEEALRIGLVNAVYDRRAARAGAARLRGCSRRRARSRSRRRRRRRTARSRATTTRTSPQEADVFGAALRERGREGGPGRVRREARAALHRPLTARWTASDAWPRGTQRPRAEPSSSVASDRRGAQREVVAALGLQRRRRARRQTRPAGRRCASRGSIGMPPTRRGFGDASARSPSRATSDEHLPLQLRRRCRIGEALDRSTLRIRSRRRRPRRPCPPAERDRRPARRREEQRLRLLQVRVRVDRRRRRRVHLEVQVRMRPVRVAGVADEADRLAGRDLRAVLQAPSRTRSRRRTCRGCRSRP